MTYGYDFEELSFGAQNEGWPPHLAPPSFQGAPPPGLALCRRGAEKSGDPNTSELQAVRPEIRTHIMAKVGREP